MKEKERERERKRERERFIKFYPKAKLPHFLVHIMLLNAFQSQIIPLSTNTKYKMLLNWILLNRFYFVKN
jgi:hypothetical protein